MVKERAKPGATGNGEYYRIEVRPKSEFVMFRYDDVGQPGHIQRLAGKKESGNWATHAWLISKEDAHLKDEKLVPDTKDAKEIIEELATKPKFIKGDIFTARERGTS